jgi:RNA polymerase sigma factor (sigma-70 family)
LPRRRGSNGDDPEFEAFFAALWARAVAVGTRMGLSREEAEDVALDAMAVAHDRWLRVAALPYRDGWLLKVTANRALRSLKRHAHGALVQPARTPLMEDEIATRMTLRHELAALPRRQRQVVTLRYLADMPEAEVAQVLGLNPGTVKQHASRGRAALHHQLGAIGREDQHV